MLNHRFCKSTAIVIVLFTLIIPALGEEAAKSGKLGFEITYIANDGVLIGWKDKQVLIDGLFRDHHPKYSNLTDKNAENMETAKKPFNDIDLILVTHIHLDHFHALSVARHMTGNPKTIMVSNFQVIGDMQQTYKLYPTIKSRIKNASPGPKKISTITANGIKVEAMNFPHVDPATFKHILTNCYLVELNGKNFFHAGDGEMNVSNLQGFDLEKKEIFMAFIPYWELLSAEKYKAIQTFLKPKYIVAMHIPPKDAEEAKNRFTEMSSRTIIVPFIEPLKSYKF
ncbi:MAG: MBL fold metallo-hydrolase [bacterium]|nr:MBL fold metallo-hydrolase [bacterium]